jgi:FlaA1/EpsC-like NDP-sugar epimerase
MAAALAIARHLSVSVLHKIARSCSSFLVFLVFLGFVLRLECLLRYCCVTAMYLLYYYCVTERVSTVSLLRSYSYLNFEASTTGRYVLQDTTHGRGVGVVAASFLGRTCMFPESP